MALFPKPSPTEAIATMAGAGAGRAYAYFDTGHVQPLIVYHDLEQLLDLNKRVMEVMSTIEECLVRDVGSLDLLDAILLARRDGSRPKDGCCASACDGCCDTPESDAPAHR